MLVLVKPYWEEHLNDPLGGSWNYKWPVKSILKSCHTLLTKGAPQKSLVKNHICLNSLLRSTQTVKYSMKDTCQT